MKLDEDCRYREREVEKEEKEEGRRKFSLKNLDSNGAIYTRRCLASCHISNTLLYKKQS